MSVPDSDIGEGKGNWRIGLKKCLWVKSGVHILRLKLNYESLCNDGI